LKKYFILIFLISITSTLFAQKSKYRRTFHEYYDSRPLHFGFLFGLAGSSFNYSSINSNGDEILSPKHFGFQIGGTVNYALSQHFEIKSGINVALFERHLDINMLNDLAVKPAKVTRNLNLLRESTWLEIPIAMKFRSLRRKNHRFYVLAGAKIGLEANTRNKDFSGLTDDYNRSIYAKKADFTLEYGIGFEQFFQFFKFSPEIRFSHGMFNVYKSPDGIDAVSMRIRDITNLKTHTVSLILNFE